MLLTANSSNKPLAPILADTLERLRLTSNVTAPEWFDLLQLSWSDYQQIKIGNLIPSEKVMERIAEHFNLKPEDLLTGKIDFSDLSARFNVGSQNMPEAYSKAAFGRMRTSITSLEFLEKYAGWKLRLDTIRKLSVSENMLKDPFAPISMNFITDLCAYLHVRQFQKTDFFAMGSHTYQANKNTLVARFFTEFSSARDAYEFFFHDCMKFFEQNCKYTITRINQTSLTVEYLTNPHVAAESGVRHLGSTHVCQLKCGIIANIPRYVGLPAAQVKEVACVHKGDDICRLELSFSGVQKINLSRFFLQH